MAQKHNLAVQAISVVGGILAAVFFLGFLALARILRSEASCLSAGSLLIIATLAINRLVLRSFLDAMNITLYIAGCVLVAFGFGGSMNMLFIALMGTRYSHFPVVERVCPPFSFGDCVHHFPIRRDNPSLFFFPSFASCSGSCPGDIPAHPPFRREAAPPV